MRETLRERITENIYGADWQLKYLRNEIRNADYYIKQNKKIIEQTKKKYPKDWKHRVSMWECENKNFQNQKLENIKHMKRWQKLKKVV